MVENEKMENKDYVQIYKRVLNYHRQYSGMGGTDAEWEECVEGGEIIARNFNKGQFVKDLIIAVQNEISRKLKEEKK